VTSGDAKRRTGNAHTGSLDIARVNAIAKSDVGVTVGADVANGGEASAEREAAFFTPVTACAERKCPGASSHGWQDRP